MDQEDVIAFLADPASYGVGVKEVTRYETHGAIVFLAGDHAYKLKRAVRYPYMDYSTLDRRRAMCEAELAVNCRSAPSIYVGVKPIVRDGNAIRFGNCRDEGDVLDWVVVMRRFEQSCLLEDMRKRHVLDSRIIRQLAEVVAGYHHRAEIRRELGGSAAICRVVEENIGLLRRYEGRPFRPSLVEQYSSLSRTALSSVSNLLEARRRDGFVRRCHGDLHLNNICLQDDEPVLFDAIEFNEDFGSIDVLYDLSFLLMDLEHHGLRRFANELLNRYLECTEDFGGLPALPLFLSLRAAIRAHVDATLADQAPGTVSGCLEDAVLRLDAAVRFLEPDEPMLIAIGGPSGTGKSTLARKLAPSVGRPPGAIILRSDVLRKKLYEVPETSPLPDEAYSEAATARVYALLGGHAGRIASAGQAVIVDAVFGRQNERRAIETVAKDEHVQFAGLWLDAPQDVLERRIASRTADASDATVEVLRRQLAVISRPTDWPCVDAGGTVERTYSESQSVLGHAARISRYPR
ncbi:MAG TPA: AAA family ATPase [Rhizomicrobium sp.]|nr:AAA family ATPase [Rhizomicrobium sp.]